MRLAAVMLVKDEADVIERTIGHLLAEGVDHVFVQDNGSTDGTRQIAADIEGVTVIDDPQVAYHQSVKTTALAQRALAEQYDWVIPCDADEIWYSGFGTLHEVILLHDESGYDVVKAELFDHIGTDADGGDPDPFRRIGWRFIEPGALHKVACRLRPDLVIEQGNHGAHSSNVWGTMNERPESGLSIRHFSWRTPEQYVRKIGNGYLAYAATTLPDGVGAHWRMFGPPDGPAFAERLTAHFNEWFFVRHPGSDDRLTYDPAPVKEIL